MENNKEGKIMENNEVMENVGMVVAGNDSAIISFDEMRSSSSTQMQMITNIKDTKKLYNIDNSEVDALLNDCEGEKIRVVDILIKLYNKPLEEPKLDEKTGEIIESERTASVILVDDAGKTYATGSKTFAWQLIRLVRDYGEAVISEGLDIEIIKKKAGQGKALGFKLV